MALEFIEMQVMNVTREQIGSWLLEDWGLPAVVVEAVRYHNDLNYDGVATDEAKLIYCVNRALRSHGLAEGPVEAIDDVALKQLGLTEADIDAALTTVLECRGELDALVHTIMHAQHV